VFVATPTGKEGLEWAQDIGRLTNAMEAAEKRKDGQVGHEWTIALPASLDAADRSGLSHELGQKLSDRYGVGVIGAVHAPARDGDERNFHLHLLFTTREIEADGLGAKVTSITSPKTAGAEVTAFREEIADTINQWLADSGSDERVDPRSFAERGISAVPSTHLGPAATAYERRGVETDREDINLAIIESRIAEQERLTDAIAARYYGDAPGELTLETERELARRFGEEWREEKPADSAAQALEAEGWREVAPDAAATLPQEGGEWREVPPAQSVHDAIRPETEQLAATGTTHGRSSWLDRLRAATEAFFEFLRDESGAPRSGGATPTPEPATDTPQQAEARPDTPDKAPQPKPEAPTDAAPGEGGGWIARVLETTRRLWRGSPPDETPEPPAPPPEPPPEPQRDLAREVAGIVEATHPDDRPQAPGARPMSAFAAFAARADATTPEPSADRAASAFDALMTRPPAPSPPPPVPEPDNLTPEP
jgi:hypothetical protein